MSSSRSEGIEAFSRLVNSDRQRLRNKLQRFVDKFNGGSGMVSVFGFKFDLYNELESRLCKLSDEEVSEVLRMMRE